MSLETINRLCRRDEEKVMGLKVGTLLRVSMAMGCAPCELVPELAQRPREGLLWERRVFTPPREKRERYPGSA